VERLRAQYRIQRAALAPEIGATAAYNNQKIAAPVVREFQLYSASVGILSYELDFFGRIQSLRDQALESYLASIEAQRSAELSLVASLATQYYAELALREQLERAQQSRGSAVAARDLTQRSFEVGNKSALDLRSAEALVARFDAEIAAIEQQLAQAQNALALLIGRPLPGDLPAPLPLDPRAALPAVAPGLPSELLQRRPDILAAEHTLKAANANIGAARAAFFPRISLTASGGAASSEFSSLFTAAGPTWQFMPQIQVPLFGAGSRFASLEASKVQKLIEVANYERAIQVAFREVADALASQKHLADQLTAREQAATAEEERFKLAEARYTAGVDNYLTVLTAQQDLFAAQQALVGVRREHVTNMIALYRALGGGFR
jgi:multidrug efflux system outer membrane protein